MGVRPAATRYSISMAFGGWPWPPASVPATTLTPAAMARRMVFRWCSRSARARSRTWGAFDVTPAWLVGAPAGPESQPQAGAAERVTHHAAAERVRLVDQRAHFVEVERGVPGTGARAGAGHDRGRA